jgi:hypothetical protein
LGGDDLTPEATPGPENESAQNGANREGGEPPANTLWTKSRTLFGCCFPYT